MATTQKAIWFQTSKEQLDALLLEVCEELQLTTARYRLAVERYGALNQLLERQGSPFQFLRPRIFPQGSMALGTTSKPVEGPHDLDFVLQIDAPLQWRRYPAFEDECLAPISVVLTTLAATYYQGEESVSDALTTILAGIVNAINMADLYGRRIGVRNPSNELEDFAERWDANPKAYIEFK